MFYHNNIKIIDIKDNNVKFITFNNYKCKSVGRIRNGNIKNYKNNKNFIFNCLIYNDYSYNLMKNLLDNSLNNNRYKKVIPLTYEQLMDINLQKELDVWPYLIDIPNHKIIKNENYNNKLAGG